MQGCANVTRRDEPKSPRIGEPGKASITDDFPEPLPDEWCNCTSATTASRGRAPSVAGPPSVALGAMDVVHEHIETALARAWRDTRNTSESWRFRAPALAITAVSAVVAAVLPTDASAGVRVALALLGTLGGAVIVGAAVLAYNIVRAPYRQRDLARAALADAQSTPDELHALAADYEAFVAAERAALPPGPLSVFLRGFQMDRGDEQRLMAEANAEVEEAKRRTLARYHEEIRARTLELLQQPRHAELLDRHGAIARQPQGLYDVETLNAVVQHIARVADRPPQPTDGDAEYTDLASDLRAMADKMDEFILEREKDRPGGPRNDQHKGFWEAANPPNPRSASPSGTVRSVLEDQERRQDRHDRQTDMAFMLEFRDDALALYDHAAALGRSGAVSRRVIESPVGRPESAANGLREVASDLDGNA